MKSKILNKMIVIAIVATLVSSITVTNVSALTNENTVSESNVANSETEQQPTEPLYMGDNMVESMQSTEVIPMPEAASVTENASERATDVAIDETNFPDVNFRELIRNYDNDNNGYLSQEELSYGVGLDCSQRGITSLKGIEYFTDLELLYCFDNQLTTLDVSNNTKLKILYCFNNQLTTLVIGNNTTLESLYCSNNQLTNLDVSQSPALTDLWCDNNQLISLDISQNPNLNTFRGVQQVVRLSKIPRDSYDLRLRDPNIDGTKITNLTGVTLNGTVMSGYTVGTNAAYIYDFGNGKTMDVTLTIDSLSSNIIYKDGTNDFTSWKAGYITPSTYEEGIGVALPTADNIEKEGYTFEGWYDNEACTGTPITEIDAAATGSKTLYAKFAVNQYTVTFKDWDGSVLKTEQVAHNTAATAPTDPIRAGYRFTGWSAAFDKVTGDMEVTAQYQDETVVVPTTEYMILEGANSIWTKGETNGIRIKSNGEFAKFTGIKVDGVEVTEENYTAEAGSTIVVMNASYLETLQQGKHTFTMRYTDGEASTEFTVMNLEIAKTGDNHIVEPLLATGGISSIAAAFAFFLKKKKKSES